MSIVRIVGVSLCMIALPIAARASEPPLPVTSAQVQKDIETVIGQFSTAMTRMKGRECLALFDRNEPAIQYLAEEQGDWLIGWDRLTWYFDTPERNSATQAMDLHPSHVRVRSLTPDLALATWEVLAEMKFRFGKPLGERFRVNAIFRHTGDGWKFIYYAEAPKSTLTYVKDMYENMASPEFRERFARPDDKQNESR